MTTDLFAHRRAIREPRDARAPRAMTLTAKAHQALAKTPRPVVGTCDGCGQPAYVWDGRVACIIRTNRRRACGDYCTGNGKPPRRAET